MLFPRGYPLTNESGRGGGWWSLPLPGDNYRPIYWPRQIGIELFVANRFIFMAREGGSEAAADEDEVRVAEGPLPYARIINTQREEDD